MPRESKFQAKRVHPHRWLWEPLEDDASFVLRPMFGAKAIYLDGKITLVFCTNEEPWRGLLVCTDRTRHDALRDDFPALVPHTIIPKWLYLSEGENTFETVAARLVELTRHRDPRIGVVPAPRKKRSAKQS